MHYLGFDIGGANLKSAWLDGHGYELDFPFWQMRESFDKALDRLIEPLAIGQHTPVRLGVTMTAELADCFESKAEGVACIVEAIENKFCHWQPRYYTTHGVVVESREAIENWTRVAAANWHATSRFLAWQQHMPDGFVLDVGSTTSDLIPILNGQPLLGHQMDLDRLRNGQLLYLGIERTPICSLLSEVVLAGNRVPLARELFACVGDALLWLGNKLEAPVLTGGGADGRPMTRVNARRRLARMLCADSEELSDRQVNELSQQVLERTRQLLSDSIRRLMQQHAELPPHFCLAGSGAKLTELVVRSLPEYDAHSWRIICLHSLPSQLQLVSAQAVAYWRSQHAQCQTSDLGKP